MGFLDEAKAKAAELVDKAQDAVEDLKDKITGDAEEAATDVADEAPAAE